MCRLAEADIDPLLFAIGHSYIGLRDMQYHVLALMMSLQCSALHPPP
jgi:hypothetical protein